MKQRIRGIRELVVEWLIPPAMERLRVRTLLTLHDKVAAGSRSANLSRNARFRNMYAGRRCFIIGNGPSLNKQDLNPLCHEITIAMNRINRHPLIERLKPTAFCMAEPGTNLKVVGLASFLDRLDASAYFFRTDVKEIIDREQLLDPENVYYLRMTGGLLHDAPSCQHHLDITRTIPGFWNTSQMAIVLALYMGCSPVYLLGFDHDWLAQRSLTPHFYPDSRRDHIDSIDAYTSKYTWLIKMSLDVWRTHEALRCIAERRGVSILNATAGGYLDVFPRVEFESLFPAQHM